jgi:hypothetical protein
MPEGREAVIIHTESRSFGLIHYVSSTSQEKTELTHGDIGDGPTGGHASWYLIRQAPVVLRK